MKINESIRYETEVEVNDSVEYVGAVAIDGGDSVAVSITDANGESLVEFSTCKDTAEALLTVLSKVLKAEVK